MKVIWSTEAIRRFEEILNYLRDHFSEKEMIQFVRYTIASIELLKTNPGLGKWSKKIHASVFVVHKKTSIVYVVKNQVIYIFTLWNNQSGLFLFEH